MYDPINPPTHASRVRAYYERNTRLFGAFGLGREARAIHRAVWTDGAQDYAAALGTVNRWLLALAERQAGAGGSVSALDLGCGVGGTLVALAEGMPGLRGVGISISPSQVRLATRLARRRGLSERCQFAEADFAHQPARGAFDLAIAIESLVHAADPARVLREAASALRPGGLLAVCDDVVVRAEDAGDAQVAAFRRGWHAPGVRALDELLAAGERAGLRLVERRDLTPLLRLLPLPGPLADALLGLGELAPRGWVFTQSLVGGLALQRCLARGVIGYHWLVWERL